MTQTPATQAPYKQLRRPTTDRMVAGVCSGLGRYLNVDPTVIRVLFAAVAVLTGGLGLLAYPVMWFVIPEEPPGAAAWPTYPGSAVPGAGVVPPGGPAAPAGVPPAPPAEPPTPGTPPAP
jgi:phage shock protein C